MKSHLLIGIKLTITTIVVFVVFYSFIIWAFAKVIAPNNGNAEMIYKENKIVGAKLVGQSFIGSNYFQSRPSAVDYNGAGSCGSNKGPSNEDYLAEVQTRIDTFLKYNPTIQKSDIPAELVTASGSGLDPHISVQSAIVQADRIASARNISKQQVLQLINEHTEKPLFNTLGTSKIHVLKLNLALDNLK